SSRKPNRKTAERTQLVKNGSGVRLPQQYLREAVLELADVDDIAVEAHHFENVLLDRNSERFRDILEFCRLLFHSRSPTLHLGQTQTFSLLFPMEVVFEGFIGNFVRRHAAMFGFNRTAVHLQAHNRRKWLLRDQHGNGRFRLKPDIVIDGHQGPAIIVDTKWKRLLRDMEDSKNGVSSADIYQLYAYAQRYNSPQNVLLYPRLSGVTAKTYRPDGAERGCRLRTAFVDLSFDLRSDPRRLIAELQGAFT
ncbi:MAG: hypothetical protein KDA96_21620, partial [Planctomycetaceae bacterium]|nr:hypothetical protein [Planctomycetaceae bacterium]